MSMLNPSKRVPILRICKPTPTTVSFTVSTRPPIQSFTAWTFHKILLASRIVLGLCTILTLWLKWRPPSVSAPSSVIQVLTERNVVAHATRWIGHQLPWRYLVPASLGCLAIILRRGYIGNDIPCELLILAGEQRASPTGKNMTG